MKIGVYIPYGTDQSVGGGYYYLTNLLNEFFQLKTNHEFVLLVDKNAVHLSSLNIQNKNKIYTVYNNSHPVLLFLRVFRKITSVFRFKLEWINKKIEATITDSLIKENIDFIYYPNERTILTDDIPFATHVWDLGHRDINYFPEVSVKREYEKRESDYNYVMSRASIVFSESEAGKRNIEYYYRVKPEKIIALPMFPGHVINTLVSHDFQKHFLNKNNLISKSFLFYPAQFWAHKNHIGLLHTLDILKEKYELIIPLVLVGGDKGNLNYVKEKIVSMGLQSQVYYLGFVSLEEQRTLYENAFALVMPTFLGPTNMPPLEAIAIGCPVLCSDFEGHRECLEDAALYFNPSDRIDMALKIKSLSDNPQLREELIVKGKKVFGNGKNTIRNSVNILIDSFSRFEIVRECWGHD